MNQPQPPRANQAVQLMHQEMRRRNALGSAALALELAQDVIAAGIHAAVQDREDMTVSDISVTLDHDVAHFRARVRVKGRAWPPRLPVDTQVSVSLREIAHLEQGDSGAVTARVHEPLEFSSALADVLVGLLGAFGKKLQLDDLRRKDALLTLDFAALVRVFRPHDTLPVRLHGLKVTSGLARVEIGFHR